MKAQGYTRETVLQYGVKDRGFPPFRVGDTIEVSQVVKEGDKERIQKFAGDVICYHRNGIATTFTVRRIGANSVGIEKIFPYYSPIIAGITLIKNGDVRRAKLFYLRDRVGKAARIKEKLALREEGTPQSEPSSSGSHEETPSVIVSSNKGKRVPAAK